MAGFDASTEIILRLGEWLVSGIQWLDFQPKNNDYLIGLKATGRNSCIPSRPLRQRGGFA